MDRLKLRCEAPRSAFRWYGATSPVRMFTYSSLEILIHGQGVGSRINEVKSTTFPQVLTVQGDSPVNHLLSVFFTVTPMFLTSSDTFSFPSATPGLSTSRTKVSK